MPGVYADTILIYLFGEFRICISNLQNFPSRRILSFYEIKAFIWKFEHEDVYISLIGGVIIFDELWAGKGIDSRANTVHGHVFSDAEVNPDVNLIYSEHRFADIHGNISREPFEGRIFCLGN